MERLVDYGLVALGVLAIILLFRASRFLMNWLIDRWSIAGAPPSADRILIAGFLFLLTGLLFLPFITSLIAFFSTRQLPGGMILHLFMVALSVILFSIAEDLFRLFPSHNPDPDWTRARHIRSAGPSLLVFWGIGVLFLSPLFYSGLTLILAAFYFFALLCRPTPETHPGE